MVDEEKMNLMVRSFCTRNANKKGIAQESRDGYFWIANILFSISSFVICLRLFLGGIL